MHGLYLVEVEGEGAGHAAVEPGLQEGRPPVGPVAGPALVVLAHPSHPGEHVLNGEFEIIAAKDKRADLRIFHIWSCYSKISPLYQL